MTDTVPAALLAAFAEGVATTYWESYRTVTTGPNAEALKRSLLLTTNSLLERMKRDQCNAFEACTAVLLTLETIPAKRLAMAAGVVVVLVGLKPGAVLNELPAQL